MKVKKYKLIQMTVLIVSLFLHVGTIFADVQSDFEEAVEQEDIKNYGDFNTSGTALYLFKTIYGDANCSETLRAKSALGISRIFTTIGPYGNALSWADNAITSNTLSDHNLILDAYNSKGYLYFRKMKAYQSALDEYCNALDHATSASPTNRLCVGVNRAKCYFRLFNSEQALLSTVNALKSYKIKDIPYNLEKKWLFHKMPPLELLNKIINMAKDKRALLLSAGWGEFQSYWEGLEERSISEDVILAFAQEQSVFIIETTSEVKAAKAAESLEFCTNLKNRMNQTSGVDQELITYVNKTIERYKRYLEGIEAGVSFLQNMPQAADGEKAFNTFLAYKAVYETQGPETFLSKLQSSSEEEVANMLTHVNAREDSEDEASFRILKSAAEKTSNTAVLGSMEKEKAAGFKFNCAYFLAYDSSGTSQSITLLQSIVSDQTLTETETGAAIHKKATDMHKALTEIDTIDSFWCAANFIKYRIAFYPPGDILIEHLCPKIISASQKPFFSQYLNDEKEDIRIIVKRQYYLGLAYFLTGEYQKAIDTFSSVVEQYKDIEYAPVACHHKIMMAVSYSQLGQKEKALDILNNIEGDYRRHDVLMKKAKILSSMGRTAEMEGVLEQIVTECPNTKEAEYAKQMLGI